MTAVEVSKHLIKILPGPKKIHTHAFLHPFSAIPGLLVFYPSHKNIFDN